MFTQSDVLAGALVGLIVEAQLSWLVFQATMGAYDDSMAA